MTTLKSMGWEGYVVGMAAKGIAYTVLERDSEGNTIRKAST
jgi:hypothetical protein